MTQKEFKEGLLRGQGRCIQAAQADPYKYNKLILWACHHELYDTTGWHGVHWDLLGVVNDGLKVTTTLIQHIFETTYCSSCRKEAFLQMRKRRMLTNDILQECMFDSNDDIRIYASQCLKKRKQ